MYSSEPNEFLNKNVLVTGASSGIGQFLSKKWCPGCHGRHRRRINEKNGQTE